MLDPVALLFIVLGSFIAGILFGAGIATLYIKGYIHAPSTISIGRRDVNAVMRNQPSWGIDDDSTSSTDTDVTDVHDESYREHKPRPTSDHNDIDRKNRR